MFDPGKETDEHLPVINGVGILEDVKERSDGRVLHVERETGVAILELLDSPCVIRVLGIGLEGVVRKMAETRRWAVSRTFWDLVKNLDMVGKEREGGVEVG